MLLKDVRETDSCRRHNRRGAPGGCGDGGVGHGGEWTISPLGGSRGTGSAFWSTQDPGCQFWLRGLGGNGVVQKMNQPGTGDGCVRWRDERSSVWAAREWNFIVAEIADDEEILGNDFAMAHKLTVRRCEGAVYLSDLSRARKEHMGERLPCTIRSVTEVRAITEETLAVRAVGPVTLTPHTITQVRAIIPTPGARGTVMIEMGPGPLGLCPFRGVVEVD